MTKRLVLALILLFSSLGCSSQEKRSYTADTLYYFPNVYDTQNVVYNSKYTIKISANQVDFINHSSNDTVPFIMESPLPNKILSGGVLMKGAKGKFYGNEPGIVGFGFLRDELICVTVSEGTWLMIYMLNLTDKTRL